MGHLKLDFCKDFETGIHLALTEANKYRGATTPNPPVGACAWDKHGKLLGIAAHQKAGEAHAEASLISHLIKSQLIEQVDTLFVTLEPCNHTGRTPPCTHAILASGIKKVIIGVSDPNPKVAGGGAQVLSQNGTQVTFLDELLALNHPILHECRELIRPFSYRVTMGMPYLTLKTVHSASGSMIPPAGKKTFSRPDSLTLAHELRRRADGIITGMGTILADNPEFTVRRVEDFRKIPRDLFILSRTGGGAQGQEWISRKRTEGFHIHVVENFDTLVDALRNSTGLEYLIEAGPSVVRQVLRTGLWNEWVEIDSNDSQDQIKINHNPVI